MGEGHWVEVTEESIEEYEMVRRSNPKLTKEQLLQALEDCRGIYLVRMWIEDEESNVD